jgi:hypothetical protein
MTLEKHNVSAVAQTSVGVMNGEESRPFVRRRPVGLEATWSGLHRATPR